MTMEIDALHAGQPMRNGLDPCTTCADWLKLKAENDALRQTLHDELDGNLRLRDLGGAKPTECMTTFLERVFAERDALRAEATAERQRWERALKQTWQAIDPLKPAGQPGSYARGYDNGFAAALEVLRGNLGA